MMFDKVTVLSVLVEPRLMSAPDKVQLELMGMSAVMKQIIGWLKMQTWWYYIKANSQNQNCPEKWNVKVLIQRINTHLIPI